jgi:hypothetical protein
VAGVDRSRAERIVEFVACIARQSKRIVEFGIMELSLVESTGRSRRAERYSVAELGQVVTFVVS